MLQLDHWSVYVSKKITRTDVSLSDVLLHTCVKTKDDCYEYKIRSMFATNVNFILFDGEQTKGQKVKTAQG